MDINATNPFRPGAGHPPPYLAGRDKEKQEFFRLLEQDSIMVNFLLTGLRGVGKTVLLDQALKTIALNNKWAWVGTDLSESASVSEERIAIRLLTDLAPVTSTLTFDVHTQPVGFSTQARKHKQVLDYQYLVDLFNNTPGLVSDKIKAVLENVWLHLQKTPLRGLVFAYDEAQNLSDHAKKNEFPMSVLLDVFQSIQRKGIPFMLVLTGLPTLFPKLVDSRTYSERMFRVVFLDRLNSKDSQDAITKPIEHFPIKLAEHSIDQIVELSKGYPYFIQFICREVYDTFIQSGVDSVPTDAIIRKLDTDFFAGRWSKATDRQRELLAVIAQIDHCDHEFSVQEVVEKSKKLSLKSFSSSHVHQMLNSLGNAGLVYKNRYAKYSFAVPLMGDFIRRQTASNLEYVS